MSIVRSLVSVLDSLVAGQTNLRRVTIENIGGNTDFEYFLRVARFEDANR